MRRASAACPHGSSVSRLRTRSASTCTRQRSRYVGSSKSCGIEVGRDDSALGDPLVGGQTCVARSMARTRGGRVVARPVARSVNHLDAVDRARCDAELASRAEVRQHRVHAFRGTEDRIDRAGVDAKRAPDAALLVDDRDAKRLVHAAGSIERSSRSSRKPRKQRDRGFAAGRAAVDVGGAADDRLGVGTSALVAAARALRLRQCVIDTLDQGGVHLAIVPIRRKTRPVE